MQIRADDIKEGFCYIRCFDNAIFKNKNAEDYCYEQCKFDQIQLGECYTNCYEGAIFKSEKAKNYCYDQCVTFPPPI